MSTTDPAEHIEDLPGRATLHYLCRLHDGKLLSIETLERSLSPYLLLRGKRGGRLLMQFLDVDEIDAMIVALGAARAEAIAGHPDLYAHRRQRHITIGGR